MAETKKKVRVKLKKDFFSEREYPVTVYACTETPFTKKLTPAVKICGKTRKGADSVTCTFRVGSKTVKCGEVWAGEGVLRRAVNLELISLNTCYSKELTTSAATGEASITIGYADSFFTDGSNRLMVAIKGTSNIVRAFRAITVRKGLGYAYSPLKLIEDQWEEEEYPELEGCADLSAVEDETGFTVDELRTRYEGEGAICIGGKEGYNVVCCEKPDARVKKECDEACKIAILRFLAGL